MLGFFALSMLAAARNALRAHGTMPTAIRRNMAVVASVKSAPDTSSMDFPAPSHVSVAGEASDLARQLRNFYQAADSSYTLSAEDRAAILEELGKRAATIPDTEITAEWVTKNIEVPEKVRLGDLPSFSGGK